ncbi:MAG TPA: adenylate/guanylate cyclase domain-containing protein [Desulfobacterales bacterium]|nr:adenylate/guanylate cyclase domain-containing protein [Desulfobacterales bacterium]
MAEQHEQHRELERHLAEAGTGIAAAVHELWRVRDETLWSADPWFHLRLAEVADALGQALFAHDVLKDALRCFPDHPLITQRYCLSLIKGGFLQAARTLLTSMVKRGHLDEETLGILGRVHKEMWLIEGDGSADHPHLAKARELYLGAFNRSHGAWSGINAASLSMIMGDHARAGGLAREVIRICAERWSDPQRRDYWTIATAAEANLLLGRQAQAASYYANARRRGDGTFSSLASTRRQLRLLARFLPVEPSILEDLRIPPVAAFTGHLIDPPGQDMPRFPAESAEAVKRRIAAVLERLDVRIGCASAASGADVLFHECLRARGGESSVVLPFDRAEFLKESVSGAGGDWIRRAESVLAAGPVEQATRGGYGGDDELFSYANRLIMGKAVLRSRALETGPVLIAVWDGGRSGAPGGTTECVAAWRKTGQPIVVIDPVRAVEVDQAGVVEPQRPVADDARADAGSARQTVAILFADLVGYSRLGEQQVPGYVRGFLAAIADTLRRRRLSPLYKNTWGDAICLVFADALEAADCALAIRDTIRRTDWSRHGLPTHLNLRIGLHAGPAFRLKEPLGERLNFFGYHVNQAARIEPITSPGNVYASEAFAALLCLDPRNPFDCRHVGVVVLPKDFGSHPIYHIKRLTEVG